MAHVSDTHMNRADRKRIRRAQRAVGRRRVGFQRWHDAPIWLGHVISLLTPSRAFAFLTLILIPVVAIYVTSADSDLVLLDPAKAPRPLDAGDVTTAQVTMIKNEVGRAVASSVLVGLNLEFQNHGFKAGHIENIELRTFPSSQTTTFVVHHVDRSVLRWREKKRLHFEFLGTTSQGGHQKYQVAFIDSEGRQVAQIQEDLALTFDSGCPTCP